MNLNEIRISLAKLLAKFSEVETDKGVLSKSEETEFAVGDEVYVTNESGEYISAPDGEYISEEKIFTVEAGKIVNIASKEQLEEVPSPEGSEEPVVDSVEELRKEVNELYSIVNELIKKVGEIDERTTKAEDTVAQFSRQTVAQPIEDVTVVNNTSFKEIVNNAKKNFI